MQYVNFKGAMVSRLTLGTVQLGMDYGISNNSGQPSAEESFGILKMAMETGINTLDTSPHYGNAEQLLGEWRSGCPAAQSMQVVTKFRISDHHLGNAKAAREEVIASIRTSLAALSIPQIPCCLFHKGKDQPVAQALEILPAIITELQELGLIDTGGFSVYYPEEVAQVLSYDKITALQVPVNIFDQRLVHSGMFKQMEAAGKLVFARSIFLQGLFFMDPDSLSGTLVKARPYLRLLQELAAKENRSVAELAFTYIRDMPGVSSLVFGAVNTQQIQQNIAWLEGAALSPEIIASIETVFRHLPEDILTPGVWLP